MLHRGMFHAGAARRDAGCTAQGNIGCYDHQVRPGGMPLLAPGQGDRERAKQHAHGHRLTAWEVRRARWAGAQTAAVSTCPVCCA